MIKAFTIVEVIIVLLLSAVVISISYTALVSVNSRLVKFQKGIKNSETLVTLDRVLSYDLSFCRYSISLNDGMSCVYDDHVVNYSLFEGGVMRTGGEVIDSFFVNVHSLRFYNLGVEKLVPYQLIDCLSVEYTVDEKSYEVSYSKNYASDVRMTKTDIHGGKY
ncbi:MAG: hypothetical protein ACK4ND_11200 [Cytophagaceae bacterium]